MMIISWCRRQHRFCFKMIIFFPSFRFWKRTLNAGTQTHSWRIGWSKYTNESSFASFSMCLIFTRVRLTISDNGIAAVEPREKRKKQSDHVECSKNNNNSNNNSKCAKQQRWWWRRRRRQSMIDDSHRVDRTSGAPNVSRVFSFFFFFHSKTDFYAKYISE